MVASFAPYKIQILFKVGRIFWVSWWLAAPGGGRYCKIPLTYNLTTTSQGTVAVGVQYPSPIKSSSSLFLRPN